MLSLKIALRYIFSKKRHNVINIVSGVSICGVAIATMAMVCILSVFNGFRELAASLFTAFDPQLKVVASAGKTFLKDDPKILRLAETDGIAVMTHVIEDNVLLRYKEKQAIGVLKGVEDNFEQLTMIDSILVGNGDFVLNDPVVDYGIPGIGLIGTLNCGLKYLEPLEVYAPKREGKISMANPASSFKSDYLYSPGVAFAVQQAKYDNSYVIAPIDLARRLFGYDKEITAVELKLQPGVDEEEFERRLEKSLGSDFKVMNRFEQQADVFNIVRIEKFMSYVFLSFILVVSGLNIIGLLSMLIIEKRDDVKTLGDMGADRKMIERIFLYEGWGISLIGATAGIVLGVVLCLLQQRFQFITLGGEESLFAVTGYPVSLYFRDVILTFLTVAVIGFVTVWYPVKLMCRRLKNA
ncbi:MAG TPA: ABC transporter permease [Candidatus Avibacteroides excrementipullorum]|nr:ABC transporter permease [Candidatus Avibacteroides excrementipullorum]